MKFIRCFLFLTFSMSALTVLADPVSVAPASIPQPLQIIEWDNNRPEQRQALDNFYRSLEQQQLLNSLDQRLLRQEHLEQLRDMTPAQRQQQIIDFAQQYQQQRQLLLPTQ